jgi:hypothetical protein
VAIAAPTATAGKLHSVMRSWVRPDGISPLPLRSRHGQNSDRPWGAIGSKGIGGKGIGGKGGDRPAH